MSQTPEDLTIRFTENQLEIVQEIDKVVLSKGAWTTILFRYREWNRSKGEYGKEKFSIRRYKKRNGEYRQHSKFNISSIDQARNLIATLQGWIDKDE
ncbi:hypothetical protein TI04_09770 [Achromatium sp. WMS2]|nr:hypothetical protein TI04_09770 [Achromatium sp. WMS2]